MCSKLQTKEEIENSEGGDGWGGVTAKFARGISAL